MIFLDGAMGTELERRGARMDAPLWSAWALIEQPELVRQIHAEYAQAGAEVLTTNSFRTHRRSLAKARMEDRASELTELSVRLAKQAAAESEREPRVAGSISPLEDCFEPGLSDGGFDDEFLEMAENLAGAGVDLLLIETMNNISKLRSALRAAQRMGVETWLSVNPSNDRPDRLLSGEPLSEAVRTAEGEGAAAFLVNCAGPETIEAALLSIATICSLPFGGYANNGVLDGDAWRFDLPLEPGAFAEHWGRLQALGAQILGGCCGTTPEHIAAGIERVSEPAPSA